MVWVPVRSQPGGNFISSFLLAACSHGGTGLFAFVGDGAGGLPVGAGGFTDGAGGFPIDAFDFPVVPGGRVDGCMLCRDTHTLATVFGKALLINATCNMYPLK